MAGSVGEYVAVARRKADVWYLGAMTGWTGCQIELPVTFLEEGKTYRAEIFCDGTNAGRIGSDYKVITQTLSQGDKLTVKMAEGGGMAARIVEEKNVAK